MVLNRDEYRSKIQGCWIGKNIGGTLGAPFEWKRQINDVDFYAQKLEGEPIPNDDLDIQLLWLIALEEHGVHLKRINAHLLAEYFQLFVTPHWAEYGISKTNMKAGLMPPLCGHVNNDYKDSCGAFIRTEIWACICPGRPKMAVQYAYQDAIIDHAHGEGTIAAIFCAVLESSAFITNDINTLLDIALSYIPEESGVSLAVKLVRKSYEKGLSWLETRDMLLEKYRGSVAAANLKNISKRDLEKGFAEGRLGWDAPSNIGIMVLALLYGEQDFGRTVCTAVNCGEDTDCTAATVGALFGIIFGAEAIPEKWKQPIGKKIVTISLDLGDLGRHKRDFLPSNLDELSERTERLADQVLVQYPSSVTITSSGPTDITDVNIDTLYARELFYQPYLNGPVYQFNTFDVHVDYGENPVLCGSEAKTIKLTVFNTGKVMQNVYLTWYLPETWSVTPSRSHLLFIPDRHSREKRKTVEYSVIPGDVIQPVNRCVVEIAVVGSPVVMYVPIVLLHQ